MPYLIFAGGAALTAWAFSAADDSLDATARVVKWGAVAGGVYIAGKYVKAW